MKARYFLLYYIEISILLVVSYAILESGEQNINNLNPIINKANSNESYTYKLLSIILIIPFIYIFYKNKKAKKNFQKYIDQEKTKIITYYNNGDEIRGDYSRYISQKRRKQKTPKSLVNEKGKIIFGTFEKEFENFNLLKAYGPTRLPNFLNKYKLTEWEAGEVNLKNGVLLGALCDMGFIGFHFNMFYDKRTKTDVSSNTVHISKNLINGNIAEVKTKNSYLKYINNFEIGKCYMIGKHTGKCLVNTSDDYIKANNIKNHYQECTIEYEFNMERISKPSVVSIPFPHSNNRTLYTQKDFFKTSGKLIINGEEHIADEDTSSLIDDHRGYYPHRMHYDWVTTMGKYNINGKKQWFAFNLTHNQSIDENSYNENIIWLQNKTSLMPPVKFTQTIPCNKFSNYSEWIIKDKYDMVNAKFKVYGIIPVITHACIFNIDYYITFGVLEGYLRDEEGKKYILDGMMGLGEDKSLLL